MGRRHRPSARARGTARGSPAPDGRRGAATELPRERARAPSQGGADRPAPGAGCAGAHRLAGADASGLRQGPPLRAAADRRHCGSLGAVGGRPSGVPRPALCAGGSEPRGRGRRDGGLGATASREGLRRVAGTRGGGGGPLRGRAPSASGPHGLAGRQAWCRAVLHPGRAGGGLLGRSAVHGGRGHEHAPRRLLLLPPQRQPTRAAWLHLWSSLRLPALPRRGPVPSPGRRADRENGPGGHRVFRGARPHPHAGNRPGDRAGAQLLCPGLRRGVRDDAAGGGARRGEGRLRPARRLLRAVRAEGAGSGRGGAAEGRAGLDRPRPVSLSWSSGTGRRSRPRSGRSASAPCGRSPSRR